MWEVLEVLRRHRLGDGVRAIARATGHDRRTIRRYLKRAEEVGWRSDTEPDEALAARVVGTVRPGPTTSTHPESGQALLLPHRDQIQAWLVPSDEKRGLQLTRIEELLRSRGVEVGYTTLRRFVERHCDVPSKRTTVRMADTPPAEIAEIDFGKLGMVPSDTPGKRRTVFALIVTLIYSRYSYVHACGSQRLQDALVGLEEAWEFFGGVTRRVILDNFRAAILKADRYDPDFQRIMAEYAQWRGFIIDPAIVRHATGKPHVERNVPFVRERFFRGGDWLSLAHVQRESPRWCREVAGMRIHGTTRRRPLEVFEAEEQGALLSLERGRFDPPVWARCKVHPDHCISFGKALYSVPTRHVGKQVDVRADSGLVRVFVGGQLVAVHPRQRSGGKAIDPSHYPPERAAYAMRDVDSVIRAAHRIGEHTGTFAESLLSGTVPWAKLRQGQKLLRLADKYGKSRVEAACRRALSFDLVHVPRLERILVRALDAEAADPQVRSGKLFTHARFLRPQGSFTHKETDDDGSQSLPEDGPQAPQTVRDPADPA